LACILACQQGLCCFPSVLGNGSLTDSCFVGNEERCLDYSLCLNLAGVALVIGGDIPANVTDPPVPEQNLTDLCSESSVSTIWG